MNNLSCTEDDHEVFSTSHVCHCTEKYSSAKELDSQSGLYRLGRWVWSFGDLMKGIHIFAVNV